MAPAAQNREKNIKKIERKRFGALDKKSIRVGVVGIVVVVVVVVGIVVVVVVVVVGYDNEETRFQRKCWIETNCVNFMPNSKKNFWAYCTLPL